MTQATWCLCFVLVLAVSASSKAHPHDDPVILKLTGTLAKVDLLNRTLELDTIDPATRTPRNMLFFFDRKVKILNGKTRVEFAELQPGQRVTCIVEQQAPGSREGRERLIVFEIRVDRRPDSGPGL